MARRLADVVGGAVEVRQRAARRRCSSASSPRATSSSRTCPGVGKTTLARALARSIDLQFARVQCTADLLPADVVGTNVFNQREDALRVPARARSSPTSCSSTRSTARRPKTQSGLLECMQERRVTVDVHSHELARPFIVLATQNPIEFEGTYPLPEAQVDRFMARVSLGYPSPRGRGGHARRARVGRPRRAPEPVADARPTARRAGRRDRACASPTRCAPTSSRCSQHTRDDPRVELGAQPARRPDAAARRQGARAARRAATTRCPTTCRRSRRWCSRTASCSRPRRSRRPGERVVADALAATPAL